MAESWLSLSVFMLEERSDLVSIQLFGVVVDVHAPCGMGMLNAADAYVNDVCVTRDAFEHFTQLVWSQ